MSELQKISVAEELLQLMKAALPRASAVTVEQTHADLQGLPRAMWLRLIITVDMKTFIVSGRDKQELLEKFYNELHAYPELGTVADEVAKALLDTIVEAHGRKEISS